MSEVDATTSADAPTLETPGEIVARAGSYYRRARYIMAVLCFAAAAWFAYDGWVKYPAQQAEYDRLVANRQTPSYTKPKDMDVQLQKLLALTLPWAGLAIIAWLLYRSRGSYRLAGDTLHVARASADPA